MCNLSQGIKEQGIRLGIEQGRTSEIFSSVQDGDYSPERGAQKMGLSLPEFEKQMAEAGYRLPQKQDEAAKKQERYYRVNPTCLGCGEEHAYFDILLSEEEQNALDEYYAAHKDESKFMLLLKGAPLFVKRTFKCPVCGTEYREKIGVCREDELKDGR